MINITIKNLLVVVLLVALFIYLDGGEPLQRAENFAYDFVLGKEHKFADERIVVVAIDDQSLDGMGSWPWSRDRFADLIVTLSQGGARLIVNTIPISNSSSMPKSVALDRVYGYLEDAASAEQIEVIPQQDSDSVPEVTNHLAKLRELFTSSLEGPDDDDKLAMAYQQAGNVLQVMSLTVADSYMVGSEAPLPSYLVNGSDHDLLALTRLFNPPDQIAAVEPVINTLGRAADAVGYFINDLDFVDTARKSRVVLEYAGVAIPSMALAVAAKSQGRRLAEIKYLGDSLHVGELLVPITRNFAIYHHFYDRQPVVGIFPTVSIADILNGSVDKERFADKIVLIGKTAPSLVSMVATANGVTVAPVELLGQRIAAMLNSHYYLVPGWAKIFKITLYLAIGIYLLLILPLMGLWSVILFVGVVSGIMLTAHYQLLLGYGLWLQFVGPILLLLFGSSLLFTLKTEYREPKHLQASRDEREEANRMLGLAFQGQGQLELAFTKFKNCHMDPMIMAMLYDLVTDFEQSRKFVGAGEVLTYMIAVDPDFRDVSERLEKNVKAQASSGQSTEKAAIPEKNLTSIDQYNLDEELGHGPLGPVLLGHNPNDNGLVAVKVIPLLEIMESDKIEESVQCFVEVLKLNKKLEHPNIVKIFRGGESFGRAFLAMEYVPGHNLASHAHKENSLPISLVIQLVAKIAMALDFAHQNRVIHGDLKLTNMLFEPESRTVKVASFAMYRLIEMKGGRAVSIRSRQQSVSYHLPPECAAGKQPDARSDIFSLGVAFYRLLTGEVPFDVEKQDGAVNLSQNLVYKPPKPVSAQNSNVAGCLDEIIGKALQIDPAKRFQRGAHMARALVNCVKSQVATKKQ